MLRPNEFEDLLPEAARTHAIRLHNGEVAWAKKDMEAVVSALTTASLAIVGLEVWAVSENSPDGRELFRRPSNLKEFIPPLSHAVDGRIVWGALPTKDGNETVFRMGRHPHPEEGETWEEFVTQMANLTREIVRETERLVIPQVADKLFLALRVASAPEELTGR